MAIQRGDFSIIQFLARHKIDVNAKNKKVAVYKFLIIT